MFNVDLRTWGPVTVLLVALTLLVTIIGGVIAIVNPDTLSFHELIDALKGFAVALGALGIGRGINAGAEKGVQAHTLSSMNGDPADEKSHAS